MKKTITKMFAVAGMVAATMFTSNAQISVGLTGGYATGMDLAKPLTGSTNNENLVSDAGYGGGLTGRYWLNDNMAVGLNISYFTFGTKDVPADVTSSYSVMPISLAFDYYFMTEGFKPFAGLEAGYVNCAWIAKYPVNYLGSSSPAFDISYNNSGLYIAPIVGAAYGVNDNIDINLNAKYMLGLNGGNQDIKYSIAGVPTTQVDTYASSFVNINLGVSYKFGN